MKKQLVLGTTLAVLATPAFATKARLQALGEEITGSQYINDNRNIFLNAAAANDYKDMVVFEWGNDGAAGTKSDAIATPQAEGGVLYGQGNMVYGAWLGGESSQTREARQYLALNNRIVHQDNQLDLFVAGDSGVKWGANLTYSQNKADTSGTTFEDIDSKTLTLRGGVMMGAIEGFANVALINTFEGDLGAGEDEEFKGKLGFELGGSYNMGHGKVFAFWRHAKWEQESDEAINGAAGTASPAYTGEADGSTDRYILGYGRETKLNDKATLFTKASYVKNDRMVETEDDGDAEFNDYAVPVVIGLEYDAESWLTLRGSITQNLMGQADNDVDSGLTLHNGVGQLFPQGKRTTANSTVVNTGATLKFGDFMIDGLLGVSGNDGVGDGDKNGVLALDRLMSRVAMTYKF
jgi:hypothetical protein